MEKLRLISYNIQCGQPLTCCGSNSSHVYGIRDQANMLSSFKPDILCLQECEVNVASDPPQKAVPFSCLHNDNQVEIFSTALNLPHYQFQPRGTSTRNSGKPQWGVAILSKYPILQMKPLKLAKVPKSCFSGGASAKWGIVCELSTPLGAIWILNVHLKVDPCGISQKSEAFDILEFIENHNISESCIICGDFNAVPCYSAIGILRKRFPNSPSNCCCCFGSFPSACCMIFPLCLNGCVTLDHCFVGNKITCEDMSYIDEGPYSDHKPLLLDFTARCHVD